MAYFSIIINGWSCSELDFNWLNKVFDWYIWDKAWLRRHLLIVDNHFSYVNWKFIERCDVLCILVLVLSLYFMHYLQFLDISLFLLFATVYINGLNKLMFDSLNMINILKWTFWNLFYPVWLISFTLKNIISGFEKAGIFSYNLYKTLDIIVKLKSSIQSDISDIFKISLTNLDVCCIDCVCRLVPIFFKILILLRAIYKLTTVHELDVYKI